MKKTNRIVALKHLALGSIAMSAGSLSHAAENMVEDFKLKGNINHSVCQWTYNFLPLDELCQVVKKIGFNAIDLIAPKDWPTLQKYGIYSSMC
jgi:hydroxypyruvate isomerase